MYISSGWEAPHPNERPRDETPDRTYQEEPAMAQGTIARPTDAWSRALARAVEECLDVLIEPISGAAFVESTSRPGTLYAVTATSCTCAAGSKGFICKHRAALLSQHPELFPPLPEVTSCIDCCGCGVIHYRTHEERCDICLGT